MGMSEIEERRLPFVPDQDDMSTRPTIAARRPSKGDECLTTEGGAAVAAVAGLDPKFAFIDEAHGGPLSPCRPALKATGGRVRSKCGASTPPGLRLCSAAP